jgi:eukaryotic-like serine/threonine-protein kinase
MAESGEEPFQGTDRFQLRRRLGSGAFGVVFEAFDRERESVVALKTLRRASSDEALYRLKREFRSLADIAHPNLVTLYEMLSDGGQWFFTMELVDGTDFLDYVRGPSQTRPAPGGSAANSKSHGGSEEETASLSPGDSVSDEVVGARTVSRARPGLPDFGRLRPALRQAAAGIRALHRAGKLHRDIKSSNVLVTRSGRVVLLDFGLVTEVGDPDIDESIAIAGTPAYMSPEQGAGQPVSEASDWYSLGVMLYEALTGQSPFTGRPAEMMREKQVREPRAPRELALDTPEDLDGLCCELLRRRPEDRPGGSEILLRLGVDLFEPSSLASVISSDARAAPFVGRQPELELLWKAFRAAEEGRPVTIAVHGGSGMGKTVLVRRFLEAVRSRHQVITLTGRCFERESVPYKALDSLMDSLSHHLKQLPPARAEALIPRDVLALARLFPVLRRVEAVAGARRRVLEIRDVQELRRRAFGALRELMARLAEERPLVLFIDDVHWGDADSAALLADLMRPPDAPPLLLIVTYRSEETQTSPLLRRLLPERFGSQWSEVVVDRLDARESRDLARVLLTGSRGENDAVAESIARESRGNPFFLSELARSVGAGADVLAVRPDNVTETGITLDGVIRERVSRLPETARRLLEIVAVAGRPVAFSVAREAAELESRENVLEVLRVGHLIRTRGTAGREEIESYHDRVREAVAAALSPETLTSYHRRLAVALEASGRADPESLALHWKGAGDRERAAEHAAVAAQQAAETLAFDRAARLYSLALDLAGGADAQALRQLRVKLGDALANAGRGADAANSYLIAAEGASTAEALELRRRAAEQLLRSGRIDQGLPVLRGVLARVGFRYAETSVGSLLSFLFHRLRIRLRGLQFRERDASQIAPEQLIRIDTCWSVSLGLAMIDTIRGRDFQARHLLLALKAGEPYRVARALATEAGFSAIRGRPSAGRTADLVEKATALAERIGQPQALGVAQLAVGLTAYLEGRWKAAWERAERTDTILRERSTGVAWELDTTHIYSLRALFYLGEIAELSARLPVLLQEAAERDDLFAATSLRTRHGYIAHLAAGDPERARQDVREAINQWSAQAFHLQHFFSLISEGDIALYTGQPEFARRLLSERLRALKASRLLRVQVFRIEWLHLRARTAIALAASSAPSQSAAFLRAAERGARAIEREGLHWGDPLASLLRAGVASVRGRREEAMERLSSAEARFEAADMSLYAAVTRRRRGEFLGDADGQAFVEASDVAMRNQKIQDPARIAAMLVPGKWVLSGQPLTEATR